jgi:DivIVA domain-containing protein
MSAMDVTPRELRDMDIREGFRGYNRDDVDELLERAAATIEQLEEQLRRHQDRLGALESDAGRGRENEEMLQRTLLLAQKTADEAIAEAQTRAKQMVEEAETRAYALVSEAEATARRMAMAEQRRLEAEVLGLGARREALVADIDNLERFEADYRVRLRRAIEADLESLDARPTVSAGSRPAVHEIELPSGEQQRGGEGTLTPQPAAATANAPANSSGAPAPPPAPPAPPIPPAPSMPTDHDTITIDAVPPFPETAPSNAGSPPAVPSFADEPRDDARARDKLIRDEEPAEAQVLDDDAFFASLREAVRDDRPLGPAGDHDYDDEDDDSGRFGNVFKRRR